MVTEKAVELKCGIYKELTEKGVENYYQLLGIGQNPLNSERFVICIVLTGWKDMLGSRMKCIPLNYFLSSLGGALPRFYYVGTELN